MSKVIGIIGCNYRTHVLQGITKDRPVAAIPFGGRYRLMDFPLSSLVNSGVKSVGIIAPNLYRPIIDHIGAGKDWFLDRKSGGMFILPGSRLGIYPKNNKVTLQDLVNNLEFLEKEKADYVIITDSSSIYNIDFDDILAGHVSKSADVTMLFKEMVPEVVGDDPGVILNFDDNSQITGIEGVGGWADHKVNYFAEIYIINRKLLLDILRDPEYIGDLDLLDVLEENLHSLKIIAAPIQGYFGIVNSIQSYYWRNMDMLEPQIREELFLGNRRIYTKIKDNPPTKYGTQSNIAHTLVSSGSLIDGRVDRSIIFRGVNIARDAEVSNSIIMQGCVIGKGAILDNVILDKFSVINPRVIVKGEKDMPVVLTKRTVV